MISNGLLKFDTPTFWDYFPKDDEATKRLEVTDAISRELARQL
jgi:hypothetical protein